VLGQPRSTQRREAHVPGDEPALVRRMAELATRYGRYGYRRVAALPRAGGFAVNHERVERLWRREGLKVPAPQPARRRLWLGDGSCLRLRPAHADHVWGYDSVQCRTTGGRAFRLSTAIGEHTRGCPAVDVARKLTADDVPHRLCDLFVGRGPPGHIRSGGGPGFAARAVRGGSGRVGVKALFIGPGSPWENGPIESSNGKVRDEVLNPQLFDTLVEARVLVERWRRAYNAVRPHGSPGYRPPAPEARLTRPPPGPANGSPEADH